MDLAAYHESGYRRRFAADSIRRPANWVLNRGTVMFEASKDPFGFTDCLGVTRLNQLCFTIANYEAPHWKYLPLRLELRSALDFSSGEVVGDSVYEAEGLVDSMAKLECGM